MRALLAGWPSVLHGEATAGDVLAMEAVGRSLDAAEVAYDVAWSEVMCPAGGLRLDDADPGVYTHLVFVCGPATGEAVAELHDRFHRSVRIAVGVSVLRSDDPVTAGFHHVLPRDVPRDAPSGPGRRDLAALVAPAPVPVIGVYLTEGQHEYGADRRHDAVTHALGDWLGGLDAARLGLDTRLDPRDWRLPGTAAQVSSVIARLDAVVTMRLHGLVLALNAGVPVVAVDPVAGGGKVSAQAAAWDWPALVPAEEAGVARFDAALSWCLSESGREAARTRASVSRDETLLGELVDLLTSSRTTAATSRSVREDAAAVAR